MLYLTMQEAREYPRMTTRPIPFQIVRSQDAADLHPALWSLVVIIALTLPIMPGM